jgi:hypothetical protein
MTSRTSQSRLAAIDLGTLDRVCGGEGTRRLPPVGQPKLESADSIAIIADNIALRRLSQ